MNGEIIDSPESRAIVARYRNAEGALLRATLATPQVLLHLMETNFQHLKRLYEALPRYRRAA
jgi:hypothetical protein